MGFVGPKVDSPPPPPPAGGDTPTWLETYPSSSDDRVWHQVATDTAERQRTLIAAIGPGPLGASPLGAAGEPAPLHVAGESAATGTEPLEQQIPNPLVQRTSNAELVGTFDPVTLWDERVA